MSPDKKLSPDDWARAALDAVAAGGVEAVSVEGLARSLCVTKGSLYWHYADRSALITAALELWERIGTIEIIERLDAIEDPAARLRALFELSIGDARNGPVDSALAARVDDPVVGPVVERVARRRVEFLERAYRDLGLGPAAAAASARIAYSTYLGHFQAAQALRDDPLLGGPAPRYMRRLLHAMVESPRSAH